jgi:hypothetical protein
MVSSDTIKNDDASKGNLIYSSIEKKTGGFCNSVIRKNCLDYSAENNDTPIKLMIQKNNNNRNSFYNDLQTS